MKATSVRFIHAGLVLLVLSALAQAQDQATPRGPLLWGADPDGGIPYVFQDPDNPAQTIGFEMDLAHALERVLGREIKFVKRSYESLLSDLERGDIDIAMNGLEILPERLQRVRFCKPYYLYQLQLVVKADEYRCQSLQACKACGFPIGPMGATAAEPLA